MGTMIRLKAGDGHELDAYRVEAEGDAAGGVVLVQEIFGVTEHIKRVARQYAAHGYTVIAPAMFDRVRRGITLPYAEIEQGRAYMQQLQWRNTLADVEAAAAPLRQEGFVAVVGFCWGGTVVHAAASHLDFDAAVSYYGGGVAKMLDKTARCPIIYHFGDRDHAISATDVDRIRNAYPGVSVYVYEGAGHGFNCDERTSYSAVDAKLAFERSISFLGESDA